MRGGSRGPCQHLSRLHRIPPQTLRESSRPSSKLVELLLCVVRSVLNNFIKLLAVDAHLCWHTAGAGISVQAGIPDFRSAHGLFQSLKKENPKENISSGKDLFDASVFNVSLTAPYISVAYSSSLTGYAE